MQGYQLRDISNADETCFFYRALPTKSMLVKGEEAKGIPTNVRGCISLGPSFIFLDISVLSLILIHPLL